MKFSEFKNQIIANYKSVMPNSNCTIELSALGKDSCFVTYYLANDLSEVPNRISLNDLFHISFHIMQPKASLDVYGVGTPLTDDTELPSSLTMEVMDKQIKTKPESEYLAYGSVTLPFRKTVGKPEGIIAVLLKYAEKVKETLTDLYEEDKLPTNQQPNIVELVKSKLGIQDTDIVEEAKLTEDEENEIEDVDKVITDEPEDTDELNEDKINEAINNFKSENEFNAYVADTMIKNAEEYEGNSLKERLLNLYNDIKTHGMESGLISDIVWYSQTLEVFDKYNSEIYDIVDKDIDFFDYLKSHVSMVEIIMCEQSSKNWIVWGVYNTVLDKFIDILPNTDE